MMSNSFIVLNMKHFKELQKVEVKLLVEEEEHLYIIPYGGLLGGLQIPAKLEKVADRPVERGIKLTELIFRFRDGENLKFPIDLTDASSWEPQKIEDNE
ncbi:MAG: hypothetical protein ACRC2R_27585 [Xenococcaceae cyanobacterium]